jgi:hypothetical protein
VGLDGRAVQQDVGLELLLQHIIKHTRAYEDHDQDQTLDQTRTCG